MEVNDKNIRMIRSALGIRPDDGTTEYEKLIEEACRRCSSVWSAWWFVKTAIDRGASDVKLDGPK